MRDRFSFVNDFGHEVVRGFLFNLIKVDFALNVVFLILNNEALYFLNPAGSEESATELISRICSLYASSIHKFEFSYSLVSNGERVHSRTHLYVIKPTELVAIIRSINQEVTDWRVVRNLLCVDFGSVR